MLKQRIITGLIAAAVMISIILFAPRPWVAAFLGLLVVIGAWEWSKLAGLHALWQRLIYSIVIAALVLLSLELDAAKQAMVLWIGLIWWLIIVTRLVLVPRAGEVRQGISSKWLCAGPLTLIPAFIGLLQLHGFGPRGADWLLFTMGIVWAADIGAYFAGRKWGKHKLAPGLSPGKSWEGVAGGVVAVAIYAGAGLWWLNIAQNAWTVFMLMSLLAALISVAGDLFESLLKREAGQKDSGTILPGHGGVLDRIDSITAAAPLVALVSTSLL